MLASADEDRCFMPFAVSIRSMVDKIKSVLEEKHAPRTLDSVGIKIPSHSYVQMQFAPKDKCTSKALAYTGDCLSILHVVRTGYILMRVDVVDVIVACDVAFVVGLILLEL